MGVGGKRRGGQKKSEHESTRVKERRKKIKINGTLSLLSLSLSSFLFLSRPRGAERRKAATAHKQHRQKVNRNKKGPSLNVPRPLLRPLLKKKKSKSTLTTAVSLAMGVPLSAYVISTPSAAPADCSLARDSSESSWKTPPPKRANRRSFPASRSRTGTRSFFSVPLRHTCSGTVPLTKPSSTRSSRNRSSRTCVLLSLLGELGEGGGAEKFGGRRRKT